MDTIFFFIVSGDANFAMSSTMITIGGFTQPGVARSLIEAPTNMDRDFPIGFCGTFQLLYMKAFHHCLKLIRHLLIN